MKLAGTFLASRVARRMFWLLSAAAAVPIVLFGLLAQSSLSEFAGLQERRRMTEATKYVGLRVLDRLMIGRATLNLAAASGRLDGARAAFEGRAMFESLAVLDAQGALQAGDAGLAKRWRGARGPAHMPSAGRAQLSWDYSSEHTAVVRLAVVHADEPGRIWVGEFAPSFLWTDRADEGMVLEVCLFDALGRALNCPRDQLAAASARRLGTEPADGRASGLWNLFLRADFGVADWAIVALGEAPVLAVGDLPLARMAGLGALATLLTVTLLSLTQVRRTLGPLEKLIEGTRRLARRDHAARVDLRRDDEFGELAHSFNHMAERVGAQFEALQVQSAIDREILAGLDVDRVMQQVLHRFGVLLPGAEPVVLEVAADPAAPLRAHRAERAVIEWRGALPAIDARSGNMPSVCAAPMTLSLLLGLPTPLLRLDAAWRQQTLAVLLLRGPWPEQADVQREVLELRDRIAVTLAAARRERELVRRAAQDSLTGLLNRYGLIESLDGRLEMAADAAGEAGFTLLFIDLDRFKEVNDSLGHQTGDQLLIQVARRMREVLPADVPLARAGGDEFVAILPGDAEHAARKAAQLCLALAQPFALHDQHCIVGASIGLARFPEDAATRDQLMRRADMAMYVAKARGRSRFAWFEHSMDERQRLRAQLARDLVGALERQEFELHFQPRIDAGTARVRSAEALLRWNHPVRGRVLPALFIDLLEETGGIERVGRWVLRTACAQLAQWRASGMAMDSIAVNLSARQLRRGQFGDEVLAAMADAGLGAGDLELELTESVLVGEMQVVVSVLQGLRDRGVRIAIDDFGTGYSSLSYLRRLPVDVLKVDRSFVMDLAHSADAHKLARAVVAMALALDKRVVAEGVETSDQAEILIEMGCHELQGYLYSPPLKADAFERLWHERFEPATAL